MELFSYDIALNSIYAFKFDKNLLSFKKMNEK